MTRLIRPARTRLYTRVPSEKDLSNHPLLVSKYISTRFVSRIRFTSRREARKSSSWKGGIAVLA